MTTSSCVCDEWVFSRYLHFAWIFCNMKTSAHFTFLLQKSFIIRITFNDIFAYYCRKSTSAFMTFPFLELYGRFLKGHQSITMKKWEFPSFCRYHFLCSNHEHKMKVPFNFIKVFSKIWTILCSKLISMAFVFVRTDVVKQNSTSFGQTECVPNF